MDDKFLHDLRREPDETFARDLREKLRELEDESPPRRRFTLAPALALAAGLAAVGALFLFPSVRASAQAMLDLFRVREFAVVQVSESRLQALRDRKLDPETFLGGKPVMEHEPAPPQRFTTLAAAAAAAGFTPEHPELLPRGLALDTVTVSGEVRSKVVVNTKPLHELMDAFEVRDLEVPQGLDGGTIEVHVPRMVAQDFRNAHDARALLVQGDSPEVALPGGVPPAQLGEIGLRLLGIDAREAHRLAGAIDWSATLVVPIVASATTFQEIRVRGAKGLYVEAKAPAKEGERHAVRGAVLWTREGRVYALTGTLGRFELMQMAESVK